ncbi:hypothetical protein Nepgr_017170 [Nepenthes gracilis]|uniref:RCC1-like domain-containing protein n=1 Tax=Nepenthes gracilis TaxID=150966 RepID=A0AAD3XSV0_NEPGR|nr:hypothetical protein Nepgr_017170 [Nepenthes gracilis]
MEESARHKGVAEEEEQQQEIWSWGAGTGGQLGTGKLEDAYSPQLLHLPSLSSFSPISLLSCGGAHVIALTSCGKVFTWGRGTSGQLGHGDTANCSLPNLVKSLESFAISHVSAGWSHSGFVSDCGHLFTCGDGSFGQLGHGDYQSQSSPSEVLFFGSKFVKQIACGMRHSLVLVREIDVMQGCPGTQVYGFGSGKRGQMGISRDKFKSLCHPQLSSGFEDAKIASITANGDHSAALTVDGKLYTWGRTFNGTSDVPFPQRFPSSLSFTQAALGWNHALLTTGEGDLFMLGGYHHAALDDLQRINPVQNVSDSRGSNLLKVPGLDGIKVAQIAAGAEHSALVTENGEIRTWGWGEHGQLGLGNTCDQTHPQAVELRHRHANNRLTSEVYCGSGFTFALRTRRDM